MVKIQQSGVKVPEVFNTLHKAVRDYQDQAAKAGDAGATDSGAAGAGNASAPFDATQNAKDMNAFAEVATKLGDKGGPLDATTKAALDTGIKAADAANLHAISEMDKAEKAYNAASCPRTNKFLTVTLPPKSMTSSGKIAKANGGDLPAAVKTNLAGMLTAKSPEDYTKSVAALKVAGSGPRSRPQSSLGYFARRPLKRSASAQCLSRSQPGDGKFLPYIAKPGQIPHYLRRSSCPSKDAA